ncbi:RNA polymerase sigma factor [Chitinophaga cymbidii]|uniref:DNA-directed RNA polymerase sigma-70 factor n=1 Tax=Chitinophaga cymbidii TaxID=1096750 RepID=A0A512RPA5_9BACT|nr:sigma-70 family RNA polymerase sigma factor [Chitinophaga cymbidii]GEP97514.1 DNA-directed RNA polymerase sigma-70 factor [Chitinophaga cymbidii]
MHRAYTEKELLLLAAGGNRQAFSELYVDCLHDLQRYIYLFTRCRETSEDIIQEIFIRLWEQRSGLGSIRSFRQYLFRMARNKVVDHVRAQRLHHRVTEDLLAGNAASSADGDHKALTSQYFSIARQAVDRLPDKRRLIFRLNTEEDLSLDEIARRLNISKSVVKKQLYAAQHYVRRYLREHAELTGLLLLLFIP